MRKKRLPTDRFDIVFQDSYTPATHSTSTNINLAYQSRLSWVAYIILSDITWKILLLLYFIIVNFNQTILIPCTQFER